MIAIGSVAVGPGMIHVEKSLAAAGIRVALKGSEIQRISVPSGQKRKAIEILKLNAIEHGYRIDWIRNESDAGDGK